MRALALLLIASFCVTTTFGQYVPKSFSTKNHFVLHKKSSLFEPKGEQLLASNQHINFATYELPVSFAANSDKCGKYKGMMYAGIGLAGGGGALFITGIALIAVGVHGVYNDTYYGGYYSANVGMVAGGYFCMVFGIASMGAGIPLAIIGSSKSKRYCKGGGKKAMLNLNSNQNGLGLAMKF